MDICENFCLLRPQKCFKNSGFSEWREDFIPTRIVRFGRVELSLGEYERTVWGAKYGYRLLRWGEESGKKTVHGRAVIQSDTRRVADLKRCETRPLPKRHETCRNPKYSKAARGRGALQKCGTYRTPKVARGVLSLIFLRKLNKIKLFMTFSNVEVILVTVIVRSNESLDSALKRFKRKIQEEEVLKEIKKHSFYMKPGEKRRAKEALARKRLRRRLRRLRQLQKRRRK